MKWLIAIFLSFCCSLPILNKALPIVRERECYRSFFPKEQLQAKIAQPIPEWMQRQIENDFKDFREIRAEAVEKNYREILRKTEEKNACFHFRILDNKLYKFAPPGEKFSSRDQFLEKAIKTLLLYQKVPDLDFILCMMDGLPEAYMPPEFYLTDRPEDQAPILANAKLQEPKTRYVVLMPDKFSLSDDWFKTSQQIEPLHREIPWESKKEQAFWRGGLTDIGVPNGLFLSSFAFTPRYQISKISVEFPEWVDAGISWTDCDAMNAVLTQDRVVKGSASKQEHLLYKYLPVLDGHMCTYPGYQWRLLSESVCFKQDSDQVQWFYSALKPYVHYIPVRNDMSDLIDQIRWAKEHDAEAKQIAQNGREFAQNHLMPADDYLYLYLVFQKYASLQRIDFAEIRKQTATDDRWKCIQYRKRLALAKTWHRLKQKLAGSTKIKRKDAKK